jgi:hypothetical protein
MPQLDIITLFSQVFWLIIIYFFSFFFFLRFYLPNFIKVFKLRFNFSSKKVEEFNSKKTYFVFSKNVQKFLVTFKHCLVSVLNFNFSFFKKNIKKYNESSLYSVNNNYISLFSYSNLRYNIYKRLYL